MMLPRRSLVILCLIGFVGCSGSSNAPPDPNSPAVKLRNDRIEEFKKAAAKKNRRPAH